jgi:hypothetical protein
MTRDLLLWFAYKDLYTPKWSNHIFDEWKEVMRRKNVPTDEIQKRVQAVNDNFGDALVTNYENIILCLKLPDPKDCHVVAAAIKTNANVIVTNNLKDFPQDYLRTFGLSIKSADDFLCDIIDLNPDDALEAFRELVLNKRNPPLDEYEVLDRFRNCELKQTADFLHSLI